jgi:hypothetical protein
MTNLITKLFGPPKEISDQAHCLTCLHRWTIFKSKRFKLYLDHSLGGGLRRDVHAYPERFVSIGFAESQDTNRLQSVADESAWMLLIGKSS